jgi:hypothetical protein
VFGKLLCAWIWLSLYRDRPCVLNELKTAITVFIRNISPTDLQKVFANKIKWLQACIDPCGHRTQHLLLVHSDFLNADLQKVFVNKIKWVQACIDAHGHHFEHLL